MILHRVAQVAFVFEIAETLQQIAVELGELHFVNLRHLEADADIFAAQIFSFGVGADLHFAFAHLAWLGAGQQALHVLERCLVGHKLLDLMLGEIADAQLAACHERACHRLKLTCEKACERGLAVSVPPDERDAVVGIHA